MADIPFPGNLSRFDPYKNYRFKVYFLPSTDAVAAISKISALKRSSDVVEYKEGGFGVARKGLGRTKYEPITLERGLTQSRAFEDWANAPQVLDKGAPKQNLGKLRKDLHIELLNEQGQPVLRYKVWRAWVSEYEAIPALDAGANAIAIEKIKIEHEGWERDVDLAEPKEEAGA